MKPVVIFFLLLAVLAGAGIGLYVTSRASEPLFAEYLEQAVKCQMTTSGKSVDDFTVDGRTFQEVRNWTVLSAQIGPVAEATDAFQKEIMRVALQKAGILRLFIVTDAKGQVPIYLILEPREECKIQLLDYNLAVDSYPSFWVERMEKELDPLFVPSRR